ncbi:MAG: GC-type dockerin domain-anchored protein [Planctomycetota bacterium]
MNRALTLVALCGVVSGVSAQQETRDAEAQFSIRATGAITASPPFNTLIRNASASNFDVAFADFNISDLAGATILGAAVTGTFANNNAGGASTREIDIEVLEGNGVAELSDVTDAGTFVGDLFWQSIPTQSGGQSYPALPFVFDVTAQLQAAADNGASHFTARAVPTSAAFFPALFRGDGDNGGPQLVLEFIPGDTSCPPDQNEDGALDIDDFSDFVVNFFAGDTIADVNDDGALDIDDFSDFVAFFFNPGQFAGCPQ